MDDKQISHYVVIIAVVAIVALFGFVAFAMSITNGGNSGGAYYAPANVADLEAQSYPDESTSSSVEGLRNCEIVQEQYNIQSYANSGNGYFKELQCPTGKIPIRTSFTKSSAEPGHPLAFCDEYALESGTLYEGVTGYIYLDKCTNDMSFEYELSATCCSP